MKLFMRILKLDVDRQPCDRRGGARKPALRKFLWRDTKRIKTKVWELQVSALIQRLSNTTTYIDILDPSE